MLTLKQHTNVKIIETGSKTNEEHELHATIVSEKPTYNSGNFIKSTIEVDDDIKKIFGLPDVMKRIEVVHKPLMTDFNNGKINPHINEMRMCAYKRRIDARAKVDGFGVNKHLVITEYLK